MPPLPEFLSGTFSNGADIHPLVVAGRLLLSLALGWVVALVYQRSRPSEDVVHSFSATLVLLTVLIAMVSQVIGDSVARAFSLVGALSIVRFRTAVRDTQDTAYVIFSVVVGMAVGAAVPVVALIGIVVVGLAAALLRRAAGAPAPSLPYRLEVRIEADREPQALLGDVLGRYVPHRRLLALATAKKGKAFDVSYQVAFGDADPATAVRALGEVEGVVGVELTRSTVETE